MRAASFLSSRHDIKARHCDFQPLKNPCILPHLHADNSTSRNDKKIPRPALVEVVDGDKITLVASETAALTASRSDQRNLGFWRVFLQKLGMLKRVKNRFDAAC